MLKSETKSDMDAKDKQMKMLQQTLKGMQEQLMQSRKQQAQDDQKIKDLTVKLNATKKEEPRERSSFWGVDIFVLRKYQGQVGGRSDSGGGG